MGVCECEKMEYGYFICPICQKKSGYDKWQRKGNMWIFHQDNAWYGSGDGGAYDFPEDCWKKTGGSSVEKWNKIGWVCGICKYSAKTFLDYVPDYKGSKEEELNKEKRKNDYLTKELINHKIDNMLLNKEADLYNAALIKKEREIQNLNYQIQDMEDQMNDEQFDNVLAITIKSIDNRINKAIACKYTDPFYFIEEEIFEEYPEYKNAKLLFTINGRAIDRNKTIDQNNINNSDIVLLMAI